MFESLLAVPFHFTIEFVGFLVAAGAALLVPSRPSLVPGGIFRRLVVALGFAALAVSQVAHGASFVPADGDPFWVLVRAGGYFLVLVGIIGGGRAAHIGSAPALVTVREPLLGAPAAAAFLLSLTALVGAEREGLAPYRRLSMAALLFAASEAMTAVVPEATFGTGVAEPLAYGAHLVRLGGYIALSWWLWTGVRVSIRTRFVAAFAAMLMVVVLGLAATLTGVISTNVEREELERLKTQLDNAVRNITETEAAQLKSRIELIRGLNQSVRQPIAERRGIGSLVLQLAQGELLGEIDFALVTNPRGNLLNAAGVEPAASRRDANRPQRITNRKITRLLGSPVLTELIDSRFDIAVSVDRVDDSSIALLAASPVRAPGSSRVVGILVIGRWIDFLTIDDISALVRPARATLIGTGAVAASRLPGDATADLDISGFRDQLLLGETVARREVLGDRAYFTAYAPLTAGSDQYVATLALSSPDRVVIETRLDVTRNLFLVALSIGIVALGLAWLSGRRITGPIQALTARAREVREGDLSAKAEVAGDDEVGQLGQTFNEMTDSLQTMTDDLRAAVREEGKLRGRIETIIQSMADGLVAVDPGGNVLAFNIEAELLTGIKAEEAIGRPIDEILEVQDGQGQRALLPISTLAEGSVGGVYLVRRFGNPVPVAVTCAVLKGDEDEPAGGVAVIRDISREHEIEKMKSEFLSNISHELRTPLTPIKGYAEILGRKDIPPEKSKHFVKGILESTARLERIVELLVDFAAMEAGRLSPKSTPVNVAGMLSSIADVWTERSGRHTVVAHVKGRLPKATGDERLLRRSVEEIVDNAVKFSPDGGEIVLAAETGTDSAGERRIEITVTDRGIGIPPEDLPKIFSDFQQLDGSETRTFGGLGLGLSFVRRIVEVHGGEIAVDSEPGRGTVFTITLPAARRGRRATVGAEGGDGGAAAG